MPSTLSCGRTVPRGPLPVLLAVGLVAVLAGCTGGDRSAPGPSDPPPSGPPSPAVGTTTHTLEVDGRERGYRLYRPASVTATGPVPLVVMLHGALGTGSQAEEAYGWPAQADRDGFLVAFPDGLNRSWAVAPDCCGPPARDGVDDVAFVSEVVHDIADTLPVDPARTYVTGMSNGGMLAYRLACDTEIFAAVGAVATKLVGGCPDPAPTSVLHIQGRLDEVIRYDGGPGRLDNGGTGRNPVRIEGLSIPELDALWREAAGCAEPAVTTETPVTRSVAACPAGRAVELVTIADAGHQWPGAAAQRLRNADPPSTALDATETIWRFFSEHPRQAGS
ncbi:PHB depolymerase family esterase [Polymorphospora rubra]|uniref:Polyhydroxybutyrate depolymerase n=2 Tax=Polymorphospora rubra TaxID=338584 RepID=A0A810N783_9ACTN|nr:hypothetical protein Prubr_50500 [Polymorphospora rubra]